MARLAAGLVACGLLAKLMTGKLAGGLLTGILHVFALVAVLHIVAGRICVRIQVLIVDDQGALLCGWHHSRIGAVIL